MDLTAPILSFVIAGGILVLALIVCGALYGCCMKTMKNREF